MNLTQLNLSRSARLRLIIGLIVAAYLAFVAYGSVVTWAVVPYIVLFTACGFIILVAFNKIDPGYYPLLLFIIALSLIWQNSMYGIYVVGNDIHRELFLSRVALETGWHPSTYTVYMTNSSFVVGFLAPFLSHVFNVGPIWVYKLILPILLAGVPVVLYLAFAREFGKKIAFFSAIFMLAVPVMSMELIGIAKSMVAELLFALMIWAIGTNIRRWRKFGVILTSLTLCLLAHYTVGIIAVAFLLAIGFIKLGLGWTAWFKAKRTATLSILLAVIVTVGAGYLFFAKVSNGAVVLAVGKFINYLPGVALNLDSVTVEAEQYTVDIVPDNVEDIGGNHVDDMGVKDVDDTPNLPSGDTDSEALSPNGGGFKLWEGMPPLMKTALGGDFDTASPWGKAFRIIQLITQVAIVLGAVYIFIRYKKYNISAEFRAGIVAALLLLLLSIVVPRIGGMINITRIYHLSLFFIAPLFVVGMALVAKKYWAYIVAGLLVVYLLFTMGFIYEVTNSTSFDKLDTPYSVAFSADRIYLMPVYTEGDLLAAEWIKDNTGIEPVVGDMSAVLLMSGYVEAIPKLKSAVLQPPYSLYNIPEDGYIFYTSWNIENNQMIHPLSEGLRLVEPLDILDGEVVYNGSAKVVRR